MFWVRLLRLSPTQQNPLVGPQRWAIGDTWVICYLKFPSQLALVLTPAQHPPLLDVMSLMPAAMLFASLRVSNFPFLFYPLLVLWLTFSSFCFFVLHPCNVSFHWFSILILTPPGLSSIDLDCFISCLWIFFLLHLPPFLHLAVWSSSVWPMSPIFFSLMRLAIPWSIRDHFSPSIHFCTHFFCNWVMLQHPSCFLHFTLQHVPEVFSWLCWSFLLPFQHCCLWYPNVFLHGIFYPYLHSHQDICIADCNPKCSCIYCNVQLNMHWIPLPALYPFHHISC